MNTGESTQLNFNLKTATGAQKSAKKAGPKSWDPHLNLIVPHLMQIVKELC